MAFMAGAVALLVEGRPAALSRPPLTPWRNVHLNLWTLSVMREKREREKLEGDKFIGTQQKNNNKNNTTTHDKRGD